MKHDARKQNLCLTDETKLMSDICKLNSIHGARASTSVHTSLCCCISSKPEYLDLLLVDSIIARNALSNDGCAEKHSTVHSDAKHTAWQSSRHDT